MFCEECGKKLRPQARFCPHCGHTVDQNIMPNAATAPAQEAAIPAETEVPKPVIAEPVALEPAAEPVPEPVEEAPQESTPEAAAEEVPEPVAFEPAAEPIPEPVEEAPQDDG